MSKTNRFRELVGETVFARCEQAVERVRARARRTVTFQLADTLEPKRFNHTLVAAQRLVIRHLSKAGHSPEAIANIMALDVSEVARFCVSEERP